MRGLLILTLVLVALISCGFSMYLASEMSQSIDPVLKKSNRDGSIIFMFWSVTCLFIMISVLKPSAEEKKSKREKEGEKILKRISKQIKLHEDD